MKKSLTFAFTLAVWSLAAPGFAETGSFNERERSEIYQTIREQHEFLQRKRAVESQINYNYAPEAKPVRQARKKVSRHRRLAQRR